MDFIMDALIKRWMNRTVTFASPMRILVNTGILLYDASEDYRCFLEELLTTTINRNREHEFIILTQEDDRGLFFSAGKVIQVKMRHLLRHPLMAKIWYDFKLPSAIKKYKADFFLSFDGWCSLNTAVPQGILFSDLSFLSHVSSGSRLRSMLNKHSVLKRIQKARTIICSSDFRKQDFTLRYSINEDKIRVVYPAVKETFQPLDDVQKQVVRMKYTDGKNYFAFIGSAGQEEELFKLLKAFSVFKKRQKSNWKLLLIGKQHQYDRKFSLSLTNYKYRSDVVVATNDPGDGPGALVGSAYALICTVDSETSVFPLLEGLKCGVALITASTPAGIEIAGDAALYFDAGNFENVADQMMTIYKDESLRSALIDKGTVIARKYNFDRSAEVFMECISRTKVVD